MKLSEIKVYVEKASKDVEFWTLNQVDTKRREVYLCPGQSAPEVNQSRMVQSQDVFLELWVKKADETLGRARGRILETDPIPEQIEKLVKQAQLTSEKKWQPLNVSQEATKKDVRSCALQFIEDFDLACSHLAKDLLLAIENTKEGIFNSSELFSTLEKHHRWSSNGFQSETFRSRIYAEVCFSETDGKNSDEFLLTSWAVRPEDLSFSELCAKSVEGAKGLLVAETTPAGTYSVLLHNQDLAQVAEMFKDRLSGGSKYMNMPFLEKGADLIEGFEGDGFELRANPLRDWALNSSKSDVWGLSSPSIVLAAENKVESHLLSQKFAQYLNEKPTLGDAVLEIHPTSASSKASGPFLEILQFSGIFVSAISQTFSSEIRLGKLIQPDGSFQYFKGGNLSGSIKGNFSKVKWGSEMGLVSVEGSYSFYGPTTATLNDVSVS